MNGEGMGVRRMRLGGKAWMDVRSCLRGAGGG